ncbi:MAG: 50S ribosomal protein L18 [Chloroflexi bacterium UTCFX4]|jgi:large subunit ribosomal protein L18|nr:MAG: 50S ribosomal protein L18 [Chloroflexi bacterium UTCFX4]
MATATKNKAALLRERRHWRARARHNLKGTGERPRLNVFRSSKHIFAQVIDDSKGHTLAAASTLDASIRAQAKELNKVEEAKRVGKLVAERAQQVGVKKVVFDRGGFRYHGRVKALADASREAGLEF